MANQGDYGTYVNSTINFDVSQLHSVDVTKPEFKELLVRLYQNVNNIISALNKKDSGFYMLTENVCSQLFFSDPALSSTTQEYPINRQVFRKVINFGQLPNTATKTVAHGITFNNQYKLTRIYGAASATVGLNYIPLPYASPVLVNNIELRADANNVYVTTGNNRTNFDECYIVIEYIKS